VAVLTVKAILNQFSNLFKDKPNCKTQSVTISPVAAFSELRGFSGIPLNKIDKAKLHLQ
jgi:hypothetical protein